MSRRTNKMRIETGYFKAEVNSVEDLKKITARTCISDRLAKQYGFKPSDCELCDGVLFIYNQKPNCVLAIDFFEHSERKFYDFNI